MQAGPVSWLNSGLIRHDASLGDERALRASNSFDTHRSIIGPTCDPALPEHTGRGACGGKRLTDGHWSRGAEEPDTDPRKQRGLWIIKRQHGPRRVHDSVQSVQSRPSVIDHKHPEHRNNHDQNLASIYKLVKKRIHPFASVNFVSSGNEVTELMISLQLLDEIIFPKCNPDIIITTVQCRIILMMELLFTCHSFISLRTFVSKLGANETNSITCICFLFFFYSYSACKLLFFFCLYFNCEIFLAWTCLTERFFIATGVPWFK